MPAFWFVKVAIVGAGRTNGNSALHAPSLRLLWKYLGRVDAMSINAASDGGEVVGLLTGKPAMSRNQ